jgi:hypothetical protein
MPKGCVPPAAYAHHNKEFEPLDFRFGQIRTILSVTNKALAFFLLLTRVRSRALQAKCGTRSFLSRRMALHF